MPLPDGRFDLIYKSVEADKNFYRLLVKHGLAFIDWANLPYASNIWDGILHNIVKPSGCRDLLFFFDQKSLITTSHYLVTASLNV